ncbi:MAG TPA: DUF6807 family protein [Gemmataceae bacterium]
MRLLSALLLLVCPAFAFADPWAQVTGGKVDEANAVCMVPIKPGDPAAKATFLQIGATTLIPAQVGQKQGSVALVFVIPQLKAGETLPIIVPTTIDIAQTSFKFVEDKGHHADLLYGNRPVLRYINAPHDPQDHFFTFKPFHHVFDPATGKVLLTSGATKTNKEGTYPHHRGLFFGWNKITYDGKAADIWHGTNNVFSQHDKTLHEEAGPAFGRQVSAISWHGKDGQTFISEERELIAYAVPGGTLIDFASTLKTNLAGVKLDGDPQHAGFHFRANQEVAKNGKQNTYYLRPDGKGKTGDTRNWDAKKPDPRTVNLPWNAMSFVTEGKRYTVLRIDHPDNPKESRGSERDYGRFGDYFEYTVTPDKPLRVKYRVWVQDGEMTVKQCEAMAAAFVHPPEVKLTAK